MRVAGVIPMSVKSGLTSAGSFQMLTDGRRVIPVRFTLIWILPVVG